MKIDAINFKIVARHLPSPRAHDLGLTHNFQTQALNFFWFVRSHHHFVRPLNKGTQLSSTLSYSQEQLPYPSQVLLLLRPWWTE